MAQEHISGVQRQKRTRPARAALTGDSLVSPVLFWWLALLGTAILIYGPTAIWLEQRWRTDQFYQHGYLVGPASAYLAWKAWPEAMALAEKGSRWGTPLILCGLLLQMANAITGIMTIGAVSFMLVATGLLLAWKGTAVLQHLGFPLFFFLFAIPFATAGSEASGMIMTPMMELAAASAAGVCQTLGLDAKLSGTIVRLPGYTMQIVAPCSGMSSLVSLMPLGALLGHLSGARPWRIAVLILAAFPIAYVANVTRLTLTALLGVSFGAKVASGFLHEASGIFTFALGAVAMYCIPRGSSK